MERIVAVTGATGHIGVALLHELKKRNEYVRVLVLPNENYDYIKGLYDEIVFGDVRVLEDLEKTFLNVESVFHIAGIITIGNEDKKLLESININGTKNVIEACKKMKVKRLIYTSSVHAIPVLKNKVFMTEPNDFNHKNVVGLYAKSKVIATNLVKEANCESLETVICFPSGVIGPYAYKRSNIGQLILDYNNHKIPMYFNGAYNYVDTRDVAFGLAQAEKFGKAGEGYILSGDNISVKDMLAILQNKTNIPMPKLKLPVFMLKMITPFAELYYKSKKLKPVFTSYSVHTLNVNCNFSNEKAKKELMFTTRPLKESFEEEIDFMLSLPKKYTTYVKTKKPKNKLKYASVKCF